MDFPLDLDFFGFFEVAFGATTVLARTSFD
jgi:hypothetical protein